MSGRDLKILADEGGGGITGISEAGLDFYASFVIDRALKNGQLPAELLTSVLNNYKKDLEDPASDASKFFRTLNTAKTPDELELFYNAFLYLINKDFEVQDFFFFLNSNSLVISLTVIGLFVENLKSSKINKMREKIFNGLYAEYGNLYNFFFQGIFNDETNNLITRKILESDSFDLKIKPKIEYNTIGEFYRSYREAEENYWQLTKEFYLSKGFSLLPSSAFEMNLPGFDTDHSKNILKFLFNRFSDSLVYGIPILLSKESVKTGYSFLTDQEENIKEILSDSFKGITKDEFYEILNEMIVDLVDYYDEVGNVINYEDGLDLPDLLSFTDEKLSRFESLSISRYDVKELKRLKFYKYFIAKFLNTSSSAFSKEVLVEEEFTRLKNTIKELREYLLTKGKFESK